MPRVLIFYSMLLLQVEKLCETFEEDMSLFTQVFSRPFRLFWIKQVMRRCRQRGVACGERVPLRRQAGIQYIYSLFSLLFVIERLLDSINIFSESHLKIPIINVFTYILYACKVLETFSDCNLLTILAFKQISSYPHVHSRDELLDMKQLVRRWSSWRRMDNKNAAKRSRQHAAKRYREYAQFRVLRQ